METKDVCSRVRFQIVRIFLVPFRNRGLENARARLLSLVKKIFRSYLWTSLQGHKMYVNARDKTITPTLLNYGVWEMHETELFKRAVRKGMIVVDLGANIGWYTLIAAKLVGKKGKVYAFEPEPDNCALLRKNVQLNGYSNVIIERKAVLDRYGSIRLFLNSDNLGDHRIYDSHDGRKSITVEGTTLDEYFRNEHDNIDVIKIDIQGAEMAALLGMDRVIKANENLKMFIEFGPTAISRSGFSPREFLNKLFEYGFKIYVIEIQKEFTEQTHVDEIMESCEGKEFVDLFL
ncbi:MAG: FkbM family methyltransferase [Candidatus Bathyarchaeota archaeon]|nr:FkbM family methyltransferase [Candidatus Bathyarchaeota archaeon]